MAKELLADYPLSAGRYDEMFAAPREPRAHWKPMLDSLAAEPGERIRERLAAVLRQVRENGVTYNVYADPQGADRPWELDLLPFIIPQQEWAAIEAAIAQRATLLNLILVDVYGEQRLLKEGLLPPVLVHGHAGFLRPCHGARAPGEVMLHLYAADLARSPDGRWWVIDDRTQAPSGAGYALENRIVISRALPELFNDLKVQRLASFFATLRDSLAHWSPQGGPGGAPLTVLLTPGPFNETYFEHAYIARYLVLPLVEGSDLTVREGCVWLKTLSGLKRVHAILRRLDDDFCDPLELRSDSALGIPGLVDAMRRGNVLVANALGSNLLESSTLLGYLPRLCEKLLGESLKMPSVATWWCGEPAALEDVAAKLERLVIKSAFPQIRVEPMFGEDLDERGRKRVLAMLRARPNDYVAQEIVQLAQAPVLDRAQPRLQARAIGLRVYACASPNGYVVMPGGLTRVAAADARVISMQRGGGHSPGAAPRRGGRLRPDNCRPPTRRPRPPQRGKRPVSLSEVLAELDATIAGFTAISGFALDGMTRDPGWRFLSIGRRLERLQTLAATLRQALAGPPDVDLPWLLRLPDSIITYPPRYSRRPQRLPLLDLLVCDEANPRSIAFQVHGLHDYVRRLADLFGAIGDEKLDGAAAGLAALDPGAHLRYGSAPLASVPYECYGPAYRLGGQPGHRFFSHVGESSQQAFAT